MAIWVEMRDRDGILFKQWRRTTLQEDLPDDGLKCVCCNAVAQEVPVHPELAKTGPAFRLVMTHDFHMHMAWRSALPNVTQSDVRVDPPKRVFGYDVAAD